MWAFKQLHKKGLLYEGFQGAAVLLGVRDAAVQFRDPSGQLLTGPARTRLLRSLSNWRRPDRATRPLLGRRVTGAGAGLDHHSLDIALQPGPGGRA